MILIGITGGMGAGKSTVLDFLRDFGAEVLDADRIVHRLYTPGAGIYEAVVRRWGRDVLCRDGTIDRTAIARMVFADGRELDWLNGLIHPRVQRVVLEQADKPEQRLLCCGVPLLYESGWEAMMEQVVSVWCSPRVQRRRLLARGWDEAAIAARNARQLSMDEKLERADFGIVNDGSLDILRTQCKYVIEKLCSRHGVSMM